MSEEAQEKLNHLLDLALSYYTEKTEREHWKIPDDQPEKQFIQEVMMICWELVGKD